MMVSQSLPDTRKARRQASAPTGYAKRPQGIKKQRPQPITPRRSTRLKQIQYLAGQTVSEDSSINLPGPLPTSNGDKISQDSPALSHGSNSGRKRKRSQRSSPQLSERDINEISQAQDETTVQYADNQGKRRRVLKQTRAPQFGYTSAFLRQGAEDQETQPGIRTPQPTRLPTSSSAGKKSSRDPPIHNSQELPQLVLASSPVKDISGQEALEKPNEEKDGRIDHWVREHRWPEREFEQDSQIGEGAGQGNWFEGIKEKERLEKHVTQMTLTLARKKSTASLRQNASDAGSVSATPSDEKPREAKSAPYRQPGYVTLLESKGSFLRESALGINDTSKQLCQTLLKPISSVPHESWFRQDIFTKTMEKVQDRNEARVIKNITPLIAPSAEDLATLDDSRFDILIENVNEGWNESIPVTKPRPQPDYCVGFKRSAFTEPRLNKLEPHLGDILFGGTTDQSYCVATWRCYFPFLTVEVKCGAGELDVADRQNAHSMTLAVRGVVELYRLAGREKELHQQILAFSVSHDDRYVRIYGHYPIIDDDKTTFYRHLIRDFSFTDQDGKERLAAYMFVCNVYGVFMPKHHKRICEAIDGIELKASEPSPAEPFQGSLAASTPHTGNDSSQEMTADSTPTQGSFKKPRLPPKVMLQQEIERLKEQLKQRDDQFTLLLESQRLLQQEIERLKVQLEQRDDQHKQEVDQQRHQMDQLIDLLKHQGLGQLKQQSSYHLEPDLSQELEAPLSQQSITVLAEDISLASSQDTTPNTSFTHEDEIKRRLRKPKEKRDSQSER